MAKKIINVFGILLAVVLSLLLLVFAIAAPVTAAATSLVQKDTLQGIVDSIDYNELLPGLVPEGQMSPQDEELILQLLETEFISEVTSLYMDDLLAQLDGSTEPPSLTVETLQELAEEHTDELVPILRPYFIEGGMVSETTSDSQIAAMIASYFGEAGEYILAYLPGLDDLGIDAETVMLISLFRSKLVQNVMTAILVILSLLVLGCRWPRFKGFMWLAVVYFLAAIPVLLLGFGVTASVPMLLAEEMGELTVLFTPVLAAMTKVLYTNAIVYLVLTVVFVLIFVFGRKLLKKCKAAKAARLAEPVTAAEPVQAAVEPAQAVSSPEAVERSIEEE